MIAPEQHRAALVPLLAGLVWLIAACSSSQELPAESRRASFTVGASPRLIVDSESGNIEVVAGPDGTISVAAVLRDAPKVRYAVRQEGDSVVVEAGVAGATLPDVISFRVERGADLTVTVPAGTSVQLGTLNGSIGLRGLSSSGTLRSGHGHVKLAEVKGDFRASTASGDIGLVQFEGSAQLETERGDVGIQRSKGVFSAKTGYGRIFFDGSLAPRSRSQLESGEGRIVVRLIETSSLALDARGSSVQVSPAASFSTGVREGSQFAGRLGTGESQLTIRAGNGSIEVSVAP